MRTGNRYLDQWAHLTEFHLPGQHDQSTHGSWASASDEEFNYPTEPEDVERAEKHYGRKEMAPSMGGPQWAFNGQSPPITSAAEDVLQGYPYDPYDRFSDYDRHQYEAAETILSTIENETSDVTLYSGHRRDREYVEAIQREGVAFPLVATTPDKDLADSYADAKRDSPGQTVAIIYEFPPGSQAGFYRFNEHIATGEYEVESVNWYDDNVVDIKLRQTKRNQVPPKIDLEEEEE